MKYKNLDDSFDMKTTHRLLKNIYRRYGTFKNTNMFTPFANMWSRYDLFLTSKESFSKDVFVLCVIYDYLNSGGGLYKIFERLTFWYTYEEYISIVLTSEIYPQEIKEILTNPMYEKVYHLIRQVEIKQDYKLDDKDGIVLAKFEEQESSKLDKYLNCINNIFENESILLYIDEYKLYSLPEKPEKLLFSKNKKKRRYIVFDDKFDAYKVIEEKFVFECELKLGDTTKKGESHSRGFWCQSDTKFGLYESLKSAEKDLVYEIEDF